VFDKIQEELAELAAEADDHGRATAELGDVMFAVVNLARHLGVDPEQALATASDKFSTRFRSMEQKATAAGRKLAEHTPDELETLWEMAKRGES
jgi:ATP diphosphatase